MKHYTALLVGTDAEGDRRELGCRSVPQGIAWGVAMMRADDTGPPWRSWEVWANMPDGRWECITHSTEKEVAA